MENGAWPFLHTSKEFLLPMPLRDEHYQVQFNNLFRNSRGVQIDNKKEVVFCRPLKYSHRSTLQNLAEAPVKWQRALLQVE